MSLISYLFALFLLRVQIATPCSVKANGKYLVPPLVFEVLILHLKVSHSIFDSSNIKSDGNRLMLERTVLFRYFVSVS